MDKELKRGVCVRLYVCVERRGETDTDRVVTWKYSEMHEKKVRVEGSVMKRLRGCC